MNTGFGFIKRKYIYFYPIFWIGLDKKISKNYDIPMGMFNNHGCYLKFLMVWYSPALPPKTYVKLVLFPNFYQLVAYCTLNCTSDKVMSAAILLLFLGDCVFRLPKVLTSLERWHITLFSQSTLISELYSHFFEKFNYYTLGRRNHLP